MATPKLLKTLADSDIEWLKNQKTYPDSIRGRPPRKGHERTKLHSIRNIARKEIADLALLATVLPEQQQKQIFNVKTLEPLFRNLFVVLSLSREEPVEFNKRIARIAEICFELFERIGEGVNSDLLAHETYQTLLNDGSQRDRILKGLNAIYLKGLFIHPNYPYHMDGKDYRPFSEEL